MTQRVFIKAKVLTFFCVVVILCYCKEPQMESSNIVYKNNSIKGIIESFVTAVSTRTSNKIVTVELKKINDTTVVSMGDTYPLLQHTKFIGVDSIKDHRIFFIGDTNKYIYETSHGLKTPQEVIDFNEKLLDPKSLPPSFDPIKWTFYFRNSSLISFTPKEEIDKYLK